MAKTKEDFVESKIDSVDLENKGRRKVVKTIIGGVTVFSAYHVLPVKWDSPIIEQIFLPAHAATSGSTLHDPCAVELQGGDETSATVTIKVTGFVTPPVANLRVLITATAVGGANQKVEGKTTTSATGTFEIFMTVGGGPGITSVNVTTVVTGAEGVAHCSVTSSVVPNLPSLTPCSMNINSGNSSTDDISFGVMGSVNPPATGVPIHVVFTSTGVVQTVSVDLVTIAGGTYAAGTGFTSAGGGFLTVGAVVTSTGATGSTSCSVPL